MNKRKPRAHLVKQLRHAVKSVKLMVSLMRQGDGAALHDIRVQARTMSSVLHPFIELPHMKPVRRCLEPIKSWVRKSNRVRDAEAQLELVAELLPEPYPKDVEHYLAQAGKHLMQKRALLAQSKSLAKLPRRIKQLAKAVDDCLSQVSSAALGGVIAHACEEQLATLRQDCAAGLQGPKESHEIRKRIKQLRYLIEYFHDFLDKPYADFVADTKRAQQDLGQLRDWQNLRAAMAEVPVMAAWLAEHGALEAELTHRASAAMALLHRKLAE